MRNILLIAVGALILMELAKKKKVAEPIPSQTEPTKYVVERNKAKVSGYYPSYLKGARPEMPYQARWAGNRFADTTKKAQLAI